MTLRTLVVFLLLPIGCSSVEKAPPRTGDEPATVPSGGAAQDPMRAERAPATQGMAPLAHAPTAIETTRFVMPIPAGYQQAPAELKDELQQRSGAKVDAVLVKPEKKKDGDTFLSSIIVAPIAGDPAGAPPLDQCRKASEAIAKVSGAKVSEKAKTVTLPLGKTCQYALDFGKQRALQTIAYLGDNRWMVTCSYDSRNAAAPGDCKKVLDGFAAPK